MWRMFHRHHRDDMAVLGVETMQEIKHLASFLDGLPDVLECVGELL